jgi:hypothetical protein
LGKNFEGRFDLEILITEVSKFNNWNLIPGEKMRQKGFLAFLTEVWSLRAEKYL